jgi:SAM-dependent methyltransferase
VGFEAINCHVCGADDAAEVLRTRDFALRGPEEFHLVRCPTCGLVFVNPRPARADMGSYYPEVYWGWAAPRPGRPYKPDAGNRRIFNTLVRDYPGGRVLDVGCGSGAIPAYMRTLGLDAIAVEPYERACQIAREHFGLEVVCAFLQDADLPDESFDAVTFFDVLEHTSDPVGDLKKARSLLKPGGAVCVKVPNIASWQARLCGRWWYPLDAPRHLFHFTPRSLWAAFEAAGFSSSRCAAVPDAACRRLFRRSVERWLQGLPPTDQSTGTAEGRAPGALHSFAGRLLYLPVALENLVGRSPELVGIARR